MIKPAKKRIITYISSTRADFGLMTETLKAIKNSRRLELQIYATGMHLLPEYGNTVIEVKNIFPEAKIIEARPETDDLAGSAQFSSNLMVRLSSVFADSRPDILLILGDRPEMLAVALVGLCFHIPLFHVHGGDKSGNIDENVRHAITKLAHIHLPATKEASQRIKKMGEESKRIFVVGAPGLESILNTKYLPDRREICDFLKIKEDQKYILLTLHPESQDFDQSDKRAQLVLSVLENINMPIVVIYPNADAGGRGIISAYKKYARSPNFKIFKHVNYRLFLGLEKEAAVWVGNSSGAMIESASFRIPVVNLGNRQHGRQHGFNVIDVAFDKHLLRKAIKKSLFDESYLNGLKNIKNPWGDGRTSERIVKILEEIKKLPELFNKEITY